MGRKETLSAFLEFLREKFDFKFDVTNFDHRLKLQKYVFIAGFLELDHGYTFTRYKRGPYSPSLAEDYYGLAKEKLEHVDFSHLLKRFCGEKFLAIKGKSSSWLEIMAMILSVRDDYRRTLDGGKLKGRVIDVVSNVKGLPHEVVDEIFKFAEDNFIL